VASTQPDDDNNYQIGPNPSILPDGLLLSANVISYHFEMTSIGSAYMRCITIRPVGSSRYHLLGFVLFRAYNDFFDYQIALLETFPREAGTRGKHPRIIRFMPGPADEVDDALSATRQQELDDYLRRPLLPEPYHRPLRS